MTAQVALDVQGVFKAGGVLAQHRPGYEERPQQTKLALAIEAAFKDRRHLTAEAGTGTGKSYAYLVPAVLSGQRTVVSTAVLALQEQLRDKDLPTLAQIFKDVLNKDVKYAVLKGLGNYTCLRNVAKQEGDLMGGDFKTPEAGRAFPSFAKWVKAQQDEDGLAEVDGYPGDMPWELRMEMTTDSDSCTGQKCPFFAQCFARTAKARAADAQILVVNHALLLRDLSVRDATDSHACAVPDYANLVIDECHELESIARDNLGIEMTAGSLARLTKSVERLTTEHKKIREAETLNQGSTEQSTQAHDWVMRVDGLVRRVMAWMDLIRDRMGEDEQQQRLGDETGTLVSEDGTTIEKVIQGFLVLGSDMATGTPAWLEDEERDQWKKLSGRVAKAGSNLTKIVTPDDASQIRYASLEGSGDKVRLTLASKPIDVAPILNEWIFAEGVKIQKVKFDKETGEDVPVGTEMPDLSVICISATISADKQCAAWRRRVGCDDSNELVVDSPFPYRKNARIYIPSDAKAFEPKGGKDRDGQESADSVAYLDRIAAEMRGLTLDARGGAFLLFTSGRAMRRTHKVIAEDLRAAGLTVFMQGEASRTEMVKRFREDGNAVIFGLKSFWAGVDIPGDALRLVVIDKLPFNSPGDVVWSALCEHVNRQSGNEWAWWNELAIPFMITMLNQGAGRLVRTMTDIGIIAVLDGRLRTKSYGKRIIRSMPDMPVIGLPEEVDAFWAQHRRR